MKCLARAVRRSLVPTRRLVPRCQARGPEDLCCCRPGRRFRPGVPHRRQRNVAVAEGVEGPAQPARRGGRAAYGHPLAVGRH